MIGTLCCMGLCFLYMNSSAYLSYNDAAKHLSYFETGYGVPTLLFGLMLTVGLVFMFFSTEPNRIHKASQQTCEAFVSLAYSTKPNT